MAVRVCSPPLEAQLWGAPLLCCLRGRSVLSPPRSCSTALLPAPTLFRVGIDYHGFLSPRLIERWALFSLVSFLWLLSSCLSEERVFTSVPIVFQSDEDGEHSNKLGSLHLP